MARGESPDCHCFGQIHSEPVGAATLVRNGALTAIALVVVAAGRGDPDASAVSWLSDLSTTDQVFSLILAVEALAIAVLGWLAVQVLTQNGRLLQRMDELEAPDAARAKDAPPQDVPRGLPVGTPAPDFTLDSIDGQPVSLDDLRAAGNPVIAIFSSPHCAPCAMLMPQIARWQRDLADRYTIAIVASGSPEDNRAKAQEHGIERVLLDTQREVASAFDSHRTPAAVMIKPDGTIASSLTGGMQAITKLMTEIATPPPPAFGDPAPAVSLPDLDGRVVTTSDFAGKELVLLFWRPGCGFCQRMAADLRAWIERRADDDPAVVLVSSESVEANRAMGIDAPILLDEEFATGRAFGARGTPAAIKIAADGTLASSMSVGAPAILQLLESTATSPSRVATT